MTPGLCLIPDRGDHLCIDVHLWCPSGGGGYNKVRLTRRIRYYYRKRHEGMEYAHYSGYQTEILSTFITCLCTDLDLVSLIWE